MTLDEFKHSLNGAIPPENLSTCLLSLWYDGKEDWVKAHDLVDSLATKDAAHVHAYLHRKEGDLFNANYWYGRAAQKMPAYELRKEWEELVQRFL